MVQVNVTNKGYTIRVMDLLIRWIKNKQKPQIPLPIGEEPTIMDILEFGDGYSNEYPLDGRCGWMDFFHSYLDNKQLFKDRLKQRITTYNISIFALSIRLTNQDKTIMEDLIVKEQIEVLKIVLEYWQTIQKHNIETKGIETFGLCYAFRKSLKLSNVQKYKTIGIDLEYEKYPNDYFPDFRRKNFLAILYGIPQPDKTYWAIEIDKNPKDYTDTRILDRHKKEIGEVFTDFQKSNFKKIIGNTPPTSSTAL
ncbi:MAG: hypothetical protein EZS28_029750, partial [Streblomastix strix]